MINFTLPHFFHNFNINNNLIHLLQVHPEYFIYKDLIFFGQEGNFPYSYWSDFNYNDTLFNMAPNMQDLQELTNMAYTTCPLLINCANPLLLEQDFYDCKLNKVLEFFNNGSNKIIISNADFKKYILEHYPFFTFIGSEEYLNYNQEKSSIDQLQLIRCNFNEIDLNPYSDLNKNKIDINITSFCNNCSIEQQKECKNLNYKEILMFISNSTFINCNKKNFYILSPDEILNLNKKGYKYFHMNLNGIELNNLDFIIDLYVKTFIKEEFQTIAYFILMYGDNEYEQH